MINVSLHRLPVRSILTALLLGLFLVFTSSCGGDEDRKRAEFAQIIDQRGTKDVLNELYIAADGDTEALARILQVTPSSIERLRKGETTPTEAFRARLKEVATYYALHEKSFRKLRSALDEEYKWYDSVLDFPKEHTTLLIVLLIVFIVVWAVLFWPILFLLIVPLVLWIVAFVCSLFGSPDPIQDHYVDTINPNVEILASDNE